jgi:GT2 family glycosyltransferase
MFRMSALRQVAFPDGTIFDESYGSYKEDVDLAFRMKHKGLRSFVLTDAIAYHARGSGDGKKDQSLAVRSQSYRNHLATIFKNFSLRDILDFPFVLCYETAKAGWYLCRDPKVLGAWRDLWIKRKELKEKRVWQIKQSKQSTQSKHIA